MEGRFLARILVAAEALTPEQGDAALAEERATGKALRSVLIDRGLLSDGAITEHLGHHLHLPMIREEEIEPDPKLLDLIPKETALGKRVLPLALKSGTLTVVVSEPLDLELMDELRFKTGFAVRMSLAPVALLQRMIDRFYLGTFALEGPEKIEFPEDLPEFGEASQEGREDTEELRRIGEMRPIVQLVDRILAKAIEIRATDIHLEPTARELGVRCRVDGMMRDVFSLTRGVLLPLTSRIKIISGMDIAQKRKPQDGRCKVRLEGRPYDLRVSSLPTMYGEKIVIRILDQASSLVPLKTLGFSEDQFKALDALLSRPQGMILVTGPTGSGKTTTLYSALNHLRRGTTNIVTVEDPVEYELAGVNQVQIHPQAGVTFASGLRSILRQDPDVVLVGEIRDLETAKIAFQAAQTGHLVLSTLHTNDTAATVTRLIDMEVEPFVITSSLLGILAQRLVRVLCASCKQPGSPDDEVLGRTGLRLAPGEVFYRGAGCPECQETGYRGRAAVLELLIMTDRLRDVIVKGVSDRELYTEARRMGMKTLFEDGLEKVLSGLTSPEELLRVVNPSESLAAERTQPTEPESRPETPPGERSPLRKERILVADDSPLVREMLRRILESEFYEVVLCEDGNEALEKIYSVNPDLVISDVMMPGMSGYELVKKIKERPSTASIPVFLLTSKDEVESELQGLEIGADDYLTKPVENKLLLARVRKALQRARREERRSP